MNCSIRATALAILAAIALACGSGPVPEQHYDPPDPADMVGPPADFSGGWISNDDQYGAFYMHCRQTGTAVAGEMVRRDFSPVSPEPPYFGTITGEVRGRVLTITWAVAGNVSANAQRKISITATPDGMHAKLRGWGPLEMTRVFAGAEHVSPQGLISCRLPYNGDGGLEMKEPPTNKIRDGLTALAYVPTADAGRTQPRVFTVPLDVPRRVTLIQFRRSTDEPVSYLFEMEYFRQKRAQSPLHAKRECMIAGSRCWWIMSPSWDEESRDVIPSILLGELYAHDPVEGLPPVDAAVIATRAPSGEWQPARGWVLHGTTVVRAQAVIKDGVPLHVDWQQVPAPPFDDFLVSKEANAWQGHTRNRLLQIARERTLPKLLRDATSQELSRLAERVEKLVPEIQREKEPLAERAKRTEKTTEVESAREYDAMYQRRLDILQPMANAIRNEIARRSKR